MNRFKSVGIVLGPVVILAMLSGQVCALSMHPVKDVQDEAKSHQSGTNKDGACAITLQDSFLPASTHIHIHHEFSFAVAIFSEANATERTDLQTRVRAPLKILDVLFRSTVSRNGP